MLENLGKNKTSLAWTERVYSQSDFFFRFCLCLRFRSDSSNRCVSVGGLFDLGEKVNAGGKQGRCFDRDSKLSLLNAFPWTEPEKVPPFDVMSVCKRENWVKSL